MRFIGDIHGKWAGYKNLIANCDFTIQVGDFGLGYYGFPQYMLKMPGVHRFIRGNHDHPQMCKKHPWYLGDWGYIPEFGDTVGGIFFIGGAWTPDFFPKKEGVNWWRDEELEYAVFDEAIHAAVELKPRIIVTHEAPREIKKDYLGRHRWVDENGDRYKNTRTDNALQVLFEQYQPELWVFGHFHQDLFTLVNGTRFVCLPEFGVYDLDF